MTGAEINEYFERGIFGSKIKKFTRQQTLMYPSDLNYSQGAPDSVCQQAHPVEATWINQSACINLTKDPNGHGYWIPYLGNGSPTAPKGVSLTKSRGLGTYTPKVLLGGRISWVMTGPFTGCYSASFKSWYGDRIFAHIITRSGDSTADTVENQVNNIVAAYQNEYKADGSQKVSGGGDGYVIWTYLGSVWYRRVFWMSGQSVKSVEPKKPI